MMFMVMFMFTALTMIMMKMLMAFGCNYRIRLLFCGQFPDFRFYSLAFIMIAFILK